MKSNENPTLVTEYTDDETPKGSPVFRQGPDGSCDDITRRVLAIITVSIVGILYLAIFSFFLMKLIDATQFNQALSAMPGPLGVAGVALLFFFRRKAIGRTIRKTLKKLM